MIDSNDPTWQAFLTAAKDYIELVENGAGADLVETCADLHSSLLELQLAALDLPETTADNDDSSMFTEAKRRPRQARASV